MERIWHSYSAKMLAVETMSLHICIEDRIQAVYFIMFSKTVPLNVWFFGHLFIC